MPNNKVSDKEKKEKLSKDRRQYYLDYFEKNKDDLTQKIVCDDCGVEYMRYNKTAHTRTKKHKNGSMLNKLASEIDNLKKQMLK